MPDNHEPTARELWNQLLAWNPNVTSIHYGPRPAPRQRVQGHVRIRPTNGLTCSVWFAYSSLAVMIVKNLPQDSRRWDKKARVWRVDVAKVEDLVQQFTLNGFVVIDERRRDGAA